MYDALAQFIFKKIRKFFQKANLIANGTIKEKKIKNQYSERRKDELKHFHLDPISCLLSAPMINLIYFQIFFSTIHTSSSLISSFITFL